MLPRVLVVSYYGADPLSPRGARTQAVVKALARDGDVHLIAGSPPPPSRPWWRRGIDRALSEVGSRWLIDPLEPWSWKALGRLQAEADVALLIGYPFSPPVVAARRVRSQGIPYLVDASDPWALTRPPSPTQSLRDRRSASLELELWRAAAAGIVTTAAQARDLRSRVPQLEVLVRPNGYTDVGPVSRADTRDSQGELRIGHFGSLYAPRIDVSGWLRQLAESGPWRRVVVYQYGRDATGELRKLDDVLTVVRRDVVPWSEVVRVAATELDLALVIGNRDPRQLPSKAVEYLTLPIPRLALTAGSPHDALAQYVADKPGWLVLSVDTPRSAVRVHEHIRGPWTPESLRPRPEESWASVGAQVAAFVLERAP